MCAFVYFCIYIKIHLVISCIPKLDAISIVSSGCIQMANFGLYEMCHMFFSVNGIKFYADLLCEAKSGKSCDMV